MQMCRNCMHYIYYIKLDCNLRKFSLVRKRLVVNLAMFKMKFPSLFLRQYMNVSLVFPSILIMLLSVKNFFLTLSYNLHSIKK